MDTAIAIGTGLLVVFAALSFVDGVYLHLWKYRLQERTESRFEHATHTLRSLLFIPILVLIYGMNTGGWLLWLGIAFLGVDLLIEVADALSERQSRSWQGGLSSGEYLLHLTITTARVASLSLILVSRSAEAYCCPGREVLT